MIPSFVEVLPAFRCSPPTRSTAPRCPRPPPRPRARRPPVRRAAHPAGAAAGRGLVGGPGRHRRLRRRRLLP
ncbi:hypothetical protein NKH77_26130 [Streptomyces sp. M19]